jgi:DNA-binding IclR family transcriptional regulator
MRKKATNSASIGRGVNAVDRALRILAGFDSNSESLGLSELAVRTHLHKTTLLRLLQSLMQARLITRSHDGAYKIGPEALRLGTLYQKYYKTEHVLLPLMRRVMQETNESAVFYVRDGEHRVCLHRVESDRAIRFHAREGDRIPLSGANGRVLRAFSGERGALYDRIRASFYYLSQGDYSDDTAGLSVPILGPERKLIGSLGISGPLFRLDQARATIVLPCLLEAAMEACKELGGDPDIYLQACAQAKAATKKARKVRA